MERKPIEKKPIYSDAKALTQRLRLVGKMIFAGTLTSRQIAAQTGLDETTILRYRNDPLVIAQVAELSERAELQAIGVQNNYIALGAKAVEAINEVLSNPVDKDTNPASVKAGTSLKVIEHNDIPIAQRKDRVVEKERIGIKLFKDLQKRAENASKEGVIKLPVVGEVEEAKFEEKKEKDNGKRKTV